MTVCVSDSNNAAYDGNLSTVNGLYRAEAYVLSSYNNTTLNFSAARTIGVTFANAGNCQGLMLCLGTTLESSGGLSVTVELQENVASVWTTRATKTLTLEEIFISTYLYANACFCPFKFATPYAVTIAASTWRFSINTSSVSTSVYLRTSNGTNACYVAWCDTQVSWADNDTLIVVDAAVVDQTMTMRGVLSAGDTVTAPACIICRHTDIGPDNVSLLTWENPPAASYTLTIDGNFVQGANSGFRMGTSASPIPYADQGNIVFTSPTYGSGSLFLAKASTPYFNKTNWFFYGEVPANERAYLASDASTGQPDIVTTVDLSAEWAPGDVILIGKTEAVISSTPWYTVSSIVGTTITLTTNLGESKRLAGAWIVRQNGYGITITGYSASVSSQSGFPANLKVSGVYTYNLTLQFYAYANNLLYQDDSVTEAYEIKHSHFYYTGMTVFAGEKGLEFYDCAVTRYSFTISHKANNGWGTVDFKRVWFLSCRTVAVNITEMLPSPTFEDCIFCNQSSSRFVLWASNPTVDGCEFFGQSSTAAGYGQLSLYNVIGGEIKNCKFNGADRAICLVSGYRQSTKITDCTFGDEVANTVDITNDTDATFSVLIEDPVGDLVYDESVLSDALNESIVKVVNNDSTTNNDMGWFRTGKWQRSGDGLTDTTTRLGGTGNFALRIEPLSSTEYAEYPIEGQPRSFPVGNIQNKTMLVSVWVKINAAAFYAGTHTKPTLNVKYDNLTTVTDVATGTTDWQRLDVVFTPTTTYGQIEIWLSMKTDATGSDAHVYIDDWNVPPPAGVVIDNSTVNQWAQGVPVWPPITTLPGPGTVLDEQMSDHTIAGSAGELLSKTEKKVDDAAILGGII